MIKAVGNGEVPRPVPWGDWNEWKLVYSQLYSDILDERRIALHRICSWRSRGKLSIAVESTASLVELSLFDSNNSIHRDAQFPLPRPEYRSENELCLGYSMAISRMVNGFVDPQQKTFVTPISTLASRINMPALFVDLRHSATHNVLPSLPVLRAAASQALAWLQETYWKLQDCSLEDKRQTVQDALLNYLQVSLASLHNPHNLEHDARTEQPQQCARAIVTIVTPNTVQEVLAPLLVDSFLAPKGKKLRTTQSYRAVPHKLQKVWRVALRTFASAWPHFITTLLFALVDRLTATWSPFSARQLSLLACWFNCLLPTAPGSTKSRKKRRKTREHDLNILHTIEPPFYAITRCCQNNSTEWSNKILDMLLSRSYVQQTGSSLRFQIGRLLKLSTVPRQKDLKKRASNDEDNANSADLELDQLEEIVQAALQKNAAVERDVVVKSTSAWERCSNWLGCPIGLLPSCEFPNLDLPAELDQYKLAYFLVPKASASVDCNVQSYQHPPQKKLKRSINNEQNGIKNEMSDELLSPIQQKIQLFVNQYKELL